MNIQGIANEVIKAGNQIRPVRSEANQFPHKIKVVEDNARQETKRQNIKLSDALETLRKTAEIFNKRLKFYIHSETKRVVVKVIDANTDKVIRQIPPEEVLRFLEELHKMIGIFIDHEV